MSAIISSMTDEERAKFDDKYTKFIIKKTNELMEVDRSPINVARFRAMFTWTREEYLDIYLKSKASCDCSSDDN